ncbi:MAG: hypothetical protein N2559_14020 [Anaerolineae bacterium]|nr:hypothetical protein [Anaerolineae bacterium]
MIRDPAAWEKWERDYVASASPDFWQNLQLVEAMYEYARALHVFPLADPLEGLETKLWLAKVINVSATIGKDRARS